MTSNDADGRIRETQRLLGQAVTQVSGIDVLLERLFLQLTGLPHDLGATIFLSHESTKRRRDLLDAVAKLRMDENQLKIWSEIKSEHSAIAERRNRLLHDTWAINPVEGTFALLKHAPPGPFRVDGDFFPKVSDDALEDLANRAGALVQRTIALMLSLEQSNSQNSS